MKAYDASDLLPPIEDGEYEYPANDNDHEVVELECEYVDHMDRRLSCVVGWVELERQAVWVEITDADGEPVGCDLDTRDAIVRKAVYG